MKQFLAGFVSTVIAVGPALADFESVSPSPQVGKRDPDGRPWTASVRAHSGYGNNVPLVGDVDPFFIGDQESTFVGLTFNGSYTFFEGDGWRFGASGTADAIGYLDDGGMAALDDYSMWAVGMALYASKDFEFAGKPAQASVVYDYRHEDAGDIEAIGLDAHRVTARLAVAPAGNVVVHGSVSVSDEDYEVTFPNPALDDRDSQRVTAEVGVTAKLGGGRHQVSASYRYTDNDADGTNWQYDAHRLKASFETNIAGPVFGRVALAREERDYNGFVSGFIPSPGRTDQDVTIAEGQVLWQLNRQVALDAYVRHEEFGSNSGWFEADDTRVGAGVTFRF